MSWSMAQRLGGTLTIVAIAVVLGGWSSLAQSCCERNMCNNMRVVKTAVAAGYATCCQREGDARATCLNNLGTNTQTLLGQVLAAQVACQNGDDALLRDIIRDMKDTIKRLLEKNAFQAIAQNGTRVENSIVGFGRRDWIELSATLSLPAGQSCKTQTVALVGDKVVNPEATGKVSELEAENGQGASLALVIPADAANALVSCQYQFPNNTPVSVRFGEEFSGTINGTISLAALSTTNGTYLALPTGAELKVGASGQSITLTLDKTSPYNKLEADANGTGFIGMALTVDSKSSSLAGCIYMGETFYFRLPVQVAPQWSSVSIHLTRTMQGHQYTPVADLVLTAAEGVSTLISLPTDPCVDTDGNGIRDGADEVNKAIDQTSECAGTATH